MFEFSIAKKYLWPRRKKLSVSLIGLLSIFVISLVIWLLLLFLSITEGIEKNWLQKVTSLNAPVRILPTEEYYNSYYYQVDAISSESDYRLKSIHEKLIADLTDPYQEDTDEEIPFYWPARVYDESGGVNDLVKNVFSAVEESSEVTGTKLVAEDYEIAGALMRLRQIRKGELFTTPHGDTQNFLTQATYIASISETPTSLYKLLEKPTMADINHLLYLADRVSDSDSTSDKPHLDIRSQQVADPHLMKRILSNLHIKKIATQSNSWQLDKNLLAPGVKYEGFARLQNNKPICIILSSNASSSYQNEFVKGLIYLHGDELTFEHNQMAYEIDPLAPIFVDESITLKTGCESVEIPDRMRGLEDCLISVTGYLQDKPIEGEIRWKNIEIIEADVIDTFLEPPRYTPPWISFVGNNISLPEGGIILPNNFRDYKVLLGDTGYFAFGSATPTSIQEQRLPTRVCGFYDPGVMAVGARFAIGEREIAHYINDTSQSTPLDPMLSTGIQVWFDDLKKTPQITHQIVQKLDEKGLLPYWKVVPFYQYEFAKDLMTQFQSDRYLFMLIGVIILFVACSNIISLLLLLVNDKKQEIGVLLSLGSTKKSIAAIFALCGVAMGAVSCVIGSLAAFFTLKNIDTLVHLLNILEGQQAFNAVFYGESLPSVMSHSSLTFILVTTPLVSMIAGLIPAIKACRLKPSAILRSE